MPRGRKVQQSGAPPFVPSVFSEEQNTQEPTFQRGLAQPAGRGQSGAGLAPPSMYPQVPTHSVPPQPIGRGQGRMSVAPTPMHLQASMPSVAPRPVEQGQSGVRMAPPPVPQQVPETPHFSRQYNQAGQGSMPESGIPNVGDLIRGTGRIPDSHRDSVISDTVVRGDQIFRVCSRPAKSFDEITAVYPRR